MASAPGVRALLHLLFGEAPLLLEGGPALLAARELGDLPMLSVRLLRMWPVTVTGATSGSAGLAVTTLDVARQEDP